jgi:acetyl esterase/lipase
VALTLVAVWPGPPARAQQPDQRPGRAAATAADPFLEIETLPLWEAGAPGARGTSPADTPMLAVFRPQRGTGNGTAVIVAPGGAYLGLAGNLEGRQVADWLAARGVTAFVLRYRLGSEYLYPIPLQDARRAVRLVRSRAATFGIAPDRIGLMGFSAGGHLAAMVGTTSDSVAAGAAGTADSVERVASRPDFLILGYPWLNAMQANPPGVLSYCGVMHLAPDRCAAFRQYSPELHVSARTPPTFIYHTTDDKTVPVEASVGFYRALAAAGVPAELHVFATGRHGSGLGLGDAALDLWPTLLEAWLRGRGLLTPDSASTRGRGPGS